MLEAGHCLQDRYRIERTLGGGGMGQVYLAYDLRLAEKPCAVKELLPELGATPEDQELAGNQFRREAATLAHLDHPNLPNVYDYFEEGGCFYLVMDYIEGETLSERMERSPDGLSVEVVVEWAVQLCDVLDYLHGQSPPVVFRDVKPSNVMVTPEGSVKLIDFGVVRLFDPSKGTDTLKMGTAGYAPPEQYAGQGQTTPRSDIYSLGVTLHELLTGDDPTAHPFVFDPPRKLNSEVPPSLSNAVMRAVSMAPQDRFPSARAMKETLEKTTQPRLLRFPAIQRQRSTGTKLLPETAAVQAAQNRPARIAAGIGRWVLRIGAPVLLALVVTVALLLVAGAFVLSFFAQSAIASADWGLDSIGVGEYIMPEDEVTEGAQDALELFALDALEDVRVDFRSPDRVIVYFSTTASDYSIEARVMERDGVPYLMLERFNSLPLYVVGGIVSGGINRGFERMWDDVSVHIDSMEVSSSQVSIFFER